eukprot:862050-Amphidinium_carterae.1
MRIEATFLRPFVASGEYDFGLGSLGIARMALLMKQTDLHQKQHMQFPDNGCRGLASGRFLTCFFTNVAFSTGPSQARAHAQELL